MILTGIGKIVLAPFRRLPKRFSTLEETLYIFIDSRTEKLAGDITITMMIEVSLRQVEILKQDLLDTRELAGLECKI